MPLLSREQDSLLTTVSLKVSSSLSSSSFSLPRHLRLADYASKSAFCNAQWTLFDFQNLGKAVLLATTRLFSRCLVDVVVLSAAEVHVFTQSFFYPEIPEVANSTF